MSGIYLFNIQVILCFTVNILFRSLHIKQPTQKSEKLKRAWEEQLEKAQAIRDEKPMESEISFHHVIYITYKPQLFQMMHAWKCQIHSLKQNKENLNIYA